MNNHYTNTLVVNRPPPAVFRAVTDPRNWWSEEIEGRTTQLGDEFTYHFGDVHRCRLRLSDLVPGERVVWTVVENHFNFTTDPAEWLGTRVRFDLTSVEGGTDIRFTHEGLEPHAECYDVCSKSWDFYVNDSLRRLIETGVGRPNPRQ